MNQVQDQSSVCGPAHVGSRWGRNVRVGRLKGGHSFDLQMDDRKDFVSAGDKDKHEDRAHYSKCAVMKRLWWQHSRALRHFHLM